MANKKGLKGALVSSIVAVALSCTTFVGTTFAWFTDSVTSTGNVIQTGTLDVEMYWAEGKEDPASVTWADASTGAIFNYANWEPGYVQARHIKVANEGTLAFKYKLLVVPNGTVSALADVIDVYYIENATTKITRADLATKTPVGTLRDMINDPDGAAYGVLGADSEQTVTIALKMREEAGNEYQKLSIGSNFSIQLLATQYTAEEDSFDNQYDKDSDYDGEITNATTLQVALTNGGKYKLTNDVELTEVITVDENVSTTIDLNGKTIGGDLAKSDDDMLALIQNSGELTLVGAGASTFARNAVSSTLTNDEVNGASVISNSATGKLTLKNVSIVGAPMGDTGYPAYAVYNEGELIVEEGTSIVSDRGAIRTGGASKTTINGGSFVVTDKVSDLGRTMTLNTIYGCGGTITINGGYFENNYLGGSGSSVVCPYGAKFYIKGGDFRDPVTDSSNFNNTANIQNYMGSGVPVEVSGGTFNDNSVEKNLASGFVAVNNEDGTYVVLPKLENGTLFAVAGYESLYTDDTNYYVYDAIGLISMRNYWKANWCNNAMWGVSYNVMADIDATGYTWDEVYVNVGNNDNLGFTFDGHGHTITGLNINGSLFTGTPNGGNKPQNPGIVQNITFDGVKVKGGHDAAVVWGNLYNELVVSNVKVINSTIVGDCNVGALVGRTTMETSPDASVKFVDCTVANNTIIANGKEGQDPNGANAFVSRAYGNTTVTFEGDNAAENNVIENKNGLVGGGIYGYTIWASEGFAKAATGTCGTFTNWNGITLVSSNEALKTAVANGCTTVYLDNGEYDLNGVEKDGLHLIGVGSAVNVANTTRFASGKAVGAITKAIHLENVTLTNTVYTMENGSNARFDNVYFKAGFRQGYGKNVVFNYCTFGSNSEGYALHFQTDSVSADGLITLNGCKFEGGKVHLGGKRAYAFVGCDFATGTDFQVWSNITLEGCEVNGEAVTASNVSALFAKLDMTKVTLK